MEIKDLKEKNKNLLSKVGQIEYLKNENTKLKGQLGQLAFAQPKPGDRLVKS